MPLAMSHVIGWVLIVGVVLIVVIGLGNMVWRLIRGDREPEMVARWATR